MFSRIVLLPTLALLAAAACSSSSSPATSTSATTGASGGSGGATGTGTTTTTTGAGGASTSSSHGGAGGCVPPAESVTCADHCDIAAVDACGGHVQCGACADADAVCLNNVCCKQDQAAACKGLACGDVVDACGKKRSCGACDVGKACDKNQCGCAGGRVAVKRFNQPGPGHCFALASDPASCGAFGVDKDPAFFVYASPNAAEGLVPLTYCAGNGTKTFTTDGGCPAGTNVTVPLGYVSSDTADAAGACDSRALALWQSELQADAVAALDDDAAALQALAFAKNAILGHVWVTAD